MTNPSATSEVVRRLYAAFEAGDRSAMETVLAADFHFTSPYDDHIDRAAWFERCWPNHDKLRAIRIEKLFVDGDEAFVRYEAEPVAGRRFRNTEFLRLKGGKVTEVEVYFGANRSSSISTQRRRS